MTREAAGIIRKIIYGLIPGAPTLVVQVGSPTTVKNDKGERITFIVSEIIEDKNTFERYGYFEYIINVKRVGSTEDGVFWKRFVKAPDAIEYFLPGEGMQELSV